MAYVYCLHQLGANLADKKAKLMEGDGGAIKRSYLQEPCGGGRSLGALRPCLL